MLESILFGILAALVLAGIVSLTYVIAIYVISPAGKGRFVVLIPSDCDGEETARLMYSAHLRLAAFGDCCEGGVYALDNGLSPEQRSVCEAMCRECGSMKLVTPEELAEMLK